MGVALRIIFCNRSGDPCNIGAELMKDKQSQGEPQRLGRQQLRSAGAGSMTLMMLWLGLTACWAVDWPQWRGANRDGVWREDGIMETFPTNALPVVWRASIGAGYSGPAVAGQRVFLMDRQTNAAPDTEVKTSWDFRDKTVGVERVVSVDEGTGKILWVHSYPCKYSAAYGSGPRVTPTVSGDRVYTLGTMGDLFCLDAASGRVVWSKNLVRDYGAKVPQYGFASQPLVDGERLIVMVGGTGQAVVAFDRATGKELWKALDASEPGYSAPLIHTFHGQRQLIVWHADGLAGLVPETGKLLWAVAYPVYAGLAITTPSIEGNRLAVSSQYEGALMLEFKAGIAAPERLWKASTGGSPEKEWKTAGVLIRRSAACYCRAIIFTGCHYTGRCAAWTATPGRGLWTTLGADERR